MTLQYESFRFLEANREPDDGDYVPWFYADFIHTKDGKVLKCSTCNSEVSYD